MKSTLEKQKYSSLLDSIQTEWAWAHGAANQRTAWLEVENRLKGMATACLFVAHNYAIHDELWELVNIASEHRFNAEVQND